MVYFVVLSIFFLRDIQITNDALTFETPCIYDVPHYDDEALQQFESLTAYKLISYPGRAGVS